MPSVTIRFDWDGQSSEAQQAHGLRELAAHLQYRTIDAFSAEGSDLMGYEGALIDKVTVDAIIDDGRGITQADRASAAVDDEHEAKARSRAKEE